MASGQRISIFRPLGQPIITDWTAYTPTITHDSGGVTNCTITGMWKQIGDLLMCRGHASFTNTPANFSGWIVSIPTFFSISATKMLNTTTPNPIVGQAQTYDSSGGQLPIGIVIYATSTTVRCMKTITVSGSNPVDTNNGNIVQNSPFIYTTNDTIHWTFQVPI